MKYKNISTPRILLLAVILGLSIDLNSAQGNLLLCSSFPCRAPSECENVGNDYVCHCRTGIKGKTCSFPLLAGEDLCLSNPCWSGGTCVNQGADWSCICPDGFTGKNCRTIQNNPCITNNPCINGGICQTVSNAGVITPVCFCVGDFTGTYCETPLPFCSKPCFNGGTCTVDRCVCYANFTGDRCQTFVQPKLDKVVKIYNKGWFSIEMYLYYDLQDANGNKNAVVQRGSIATLQDFGFYIPLTVDYYSGLGVTLVVDAIGGKNIMTVRLRENPECFHVWGTTQIPFWSKMPCWNRCC